VPLTWQNLNNEELKTISEDLIKDIERKLQVDEDEISYIKEYINVDYKKSKIIKIKDRKVKLESVVRSLDDWNKKFNSKELKKTSKIEEIDSKIEELEKDKKDISSNFDSKKELYILNNIILQII